MTSVTAIKILLLLCLLYVTTTATPTPPQSIINAAEILSKSGYSAMSFSIHLLLSDSSFPTPITTTSTGADSTTTRTAGSATGKVTTTTKGGNTSSAANPKVPTTRDSSTTTSGGKLSSHPTLTIFAPPDSVFATSGQPSRAQLLLHFCPLLLSVQSLSSLPFATIIPTLSTASIMITTTSIGGGPVSINNVTVLESLIYEDGSVIVFAIEKFFDSDFPIHDVGKIQNIIPKCSDISPFSMFFDASSRLKSRGYSIMASFLELQLMGYLKSSPWPLKLTVFAPEDEVLLKFAGDILGYSRLFMRHLLPCKLTYADIDGLNGIVFKKNFEGLSTVIERKNKKFFVNGARITFPDLYVSDSLVIHGIGDTISQDLVGSGGQDVVVEENKHSKSNDEEASHHNANEL